jgi:Zn-dependent protease with chaperone function
VADSAARRLGRKVRLGRFGLLLLCTGLALATTQKKLPKPGWNIFTKKQDIELGREYAKKVESSMYVIPNDELTNYVTRIGMRLIRDGGLDDYPYFFKVVQDDSINAFALPGGPMYVHTGLIKAADNEAQIAGVLAHELSHIVLRHGTHQATRAEFLQLPALLASAASRGGLAGALEQIGVGLGSNSMLLSFSRGMESEADLLGTYTMAKAGYNPIELPRFFEKLEAQGGNPGSLVARFLSDHPSPGNRIQAIEEQLPYMPRGPYDAQEGDLVHAKEIVAQFDSGRDGKTPRPWPRVQSGNAESAENPVRPPAVPSIEVSGRLLDYQSRGVLFSYPEEWKVRQNPDGSLTVTSSDGVVGDSVGYGMIVNFLEPHNGQVQLRTDTDTFVQSLQQSPSHVHVDTAPQDLTAGGSPALLTRLSSDSPYSGHRETDVVLTVDRNSLMVAIIFVAPQTRFPDLEGIFRRISQSVKFAN